jgi:hypothetical protein
MASLALTFFSHQPSNTKPSFSLLLNIAPAIAIARVPDLSKRMDKQESEREGESFKVLAAGDWKMKYCRLLLLHFLYTDLAIAL